MGERNEGNRVVSELEKRAARLEDVPPMLDDIATLEYLALRGLYAQFQAGQITRERAKEEKHKIALAVKGARWGDEVAQHGHRVVIETQLANIECRKNPTPENVIKLCNILDGLEKEW